MLPINTHESIDTALCGEPVQIADGIAEVRLLTTARMAADSKQLVHGGFVFGAVDYAAMLAVNDPNVVLGSARVKFLAPVRVGQTVLCRAYVKSSEGKKRLVEVNASADGVAVLAGELDCFVLTQHVLEPKGT